MLQDVDSAVLIAQEVERDERAVAALRFHPHVVDISQPLQDIRTVGKHLLVTHVFQLTDFAYDMTLIVNAVQVVDNLSADGYQAVCCFRTSLTVIIRSTSIAVLKNIVCWSIILSVSRMRSTMCLRFSSKSLSRSFLTLKSGSCL